MLMPSVLMYGILSNISFTMGFVLPDPLPVYYLPKELLKLFLVAFALSFGVNVFILPVTSRKIFLVVPCNSMLILRYHSPILSILFQLFSKPTTILFPLPPISAISNTNSLF